MKTIIILSVLIISYGTYAKSSKDDNKLDSIIEDGWKFSLKQSPQRAHFFSKNAPADILNDVSERHLNETAAGYQDILNKLSKIKRNKLSSENKINYDMYQGVLASLVADIEFKEYQFPINHQSKDQQHH